MGGWFHASVKTVKRSDGRSATAAAAYRSAALIHDERTGDTHDYRRKGGVLDTFILAPDGVPDWVHDRAALWNKAEAEKHPRARTARELELALPASLSADERRAIAHDMAAELVARYGVAVDVAMHAPHRDGDDRNFHAHLLFTTRAVTPDGFGDKTRNLDNANTSGAEVEHIRAQAAAIINGYLERAGRAERVDHRSLEGQGETQREPTQHLGPAASQMERDGRPSRIGTANRKIRIMAKRHESLRRHLWQIERSIKTEEGRAWQGKGRAPRSIDWQFNKTAGQGVAKKAAQQLKAAAATLRAGLAATEKAAKDARSAEIRKLLAERQEQRAGIVAFYAVRLDGVWKPQQGQTPTPDRSALARDAVRLNEQARQFEQRELSMRGRLTNAADLAGPGASFARRMRLALDASLRRDTFEQRQQQERTAAAQGVYQAPRDGPRPATPSPKSYFAGRLNESRKAMLWEFDTETGKMVQALKASHAEARAAEKQTRAETGKEIAAAWQEFRATHQIVARPEQPFNRAATGPTPAAPWRLVSAPSGMSKIGQGRSPALPFHRAGQPHAMPFNPAAHGFNAPAVAPIKAKTMAAENSAAMDAEKGREAVQTFEGQETTPQPSEAIHAPELGPAWAETATGEPVRIWTDADRAALDAMKEQRAAEQQQVQTHDLGRTR